MAFKEIFSGGYFPGGFYPGELYPDTLARTYFSGFPHPLKSPYWIFRSCGKKFQNADQIWNFTLNHFALCDRFNIPDGSKDMGVSNWRFSLLKIVTIYLKIHILPPRGEIHWVNADQLPRFELEGHPDQQHIVPMRFLINTKQSLPIPKSYPVFFSNFQYRLLWYQEFLLKYLNLLST